MTQNSASVRHNSSQCRYELELEGSICGSASYVDDGDRQIFTHTEIDDSLEGRGLGSLLLRESLEDARRRGKRVVPQCPFVASYIERHPEWNDIVEMPDAASREEGQP